MEPRLGTPGQRLSPWPGPAAAAELDLRADAAIDADRLLLRYDLRWTPDWAPLLQPPLQPPPQNPQRRDGLWQQTCFEAFVAPANTETYWEINLAPWGDWNVYALSGYRQGLRPERAIDALPFSEQRWLEAGRSVLQLEVRVPLPPPLLAAGSLQLGLSAVIAHDPARHGEELSYWALAHRGDQPDFHDRRSWILTL